MGGKVDTSNRMGVAAGRYGGQIFGQTNAARNMLFKQLASALQTGGGKGFRMPFVQQAVARSRAAGTAAMAGARGGLAGVDASIRNRVLNRMSMTNRQITSQIPTAVASQMIQQAPSTALGQVGPAAAGLATGISGQQAGIEATVSRMKAFSQMMGQIAQAVGSKTEGDFMRSNPGTSGVRTGGGIDPYASYPGRSLDPAVINARATEYDRRAALATGTAMPAQPSQSWFSRFSNMWGGS